MQEKRMEDEIEIDLRELVGVILHWFWLIAICATVAGVAGFVVSKFMMTPKYDSTTKIIVLSKSDEGSLIYSDLQISSQLVKDYPELIKSRSVLETVINNCGLKGGYGALYSRVAVSSSSDSRIIAITVKDEDPAMAKKIADEVRSIAAEKIKAVMDIEAVNVVDEASLPTSPSEPSVVKFTLIAFILGGFACAGVIIVRFLLDDTIKVADDIEKYLGLSSLGMIPDGSVKEKKSKKSRKSIKK